MTLQLLVGFRFHVLFHSPPGVLFTFPSRYWYAIGRQTVLSLTGWSPQIHPEFHVYRATRVPHRQNTYRRLRGCHPLWPGFPSVFS